MSDSVRPHRRQPIGLRHPWHSPGKNTGVGCHFPLQCMKVKIESEVAQLCPALCDPMDSRLPGSSVHGIFQARVLEWDAIAFSNNTHRLLYISTNSYPERNSARYTIQSFIPLALLNPNFVPGTVQWARDEKQDLTVW